MLETILAGMSGGSHGVFIFFKLKRLSTISSFVIPVNVAKKIVIFDHFSTTLSIFSGSMAFWFDLLTFDTPIAYAPTRITDVGGVS
jgi:hypothetical protein